MELNWPLSVGPPAFVDIPIVLLDCEKDASAQWRAAKEHFEKTGSAAPKWKDYVLLAEQERFRLHVRGQASRGFPEFHTAVQLTNAGFECWSGVQFFDYGKPLVKEGLRKKNTKRVRELWEQSLTAPWPATIQKDLAGPRVRNPDIAAFSRRRNEWRFCETKSWTDEINPDQVTGLAVLHLLTGAPVSIVRLLPMGRSMKGSRFERGVIRYSDGGDVKWANVSDLAIHGGTGGLFKKVE